jgi:hypothetical protein
MNNCLCPQCGHEFSKKNGKLYKRPWFLFFKPSMSPSNFLNYELEKYNHVKCPRCATEFKCESIKFFGILDAGGIDIFIKIFLFIFLVVVFIVLFKSI